VTARFAVGAAVASLLVACGSAHVAPPPRTNLIAFTRTAFSAAHPAGVSSVVAVPAGGGAAVTLAANGSNPAWSPDGKHFVFHDERTGDLYIVNADGSDSRKLVHRDRDLSEAADWSLDGKRLVFTRRDPDICCPSEEIYVVNVDGSGLHELTNDAVYHSSPRWSPDGRWIAFLRGEDVSMTRTELDLCLMRSDGSGQRCLTQTREDEGPASWSPDGTLLAFGKARAGKASPGNYVQIGEDIVVLSLRTRRTQILVGTATWDSTPAWSPDGRTIAFTRRSSRYAQGRTYLTDADGRNVRPLRVHPRGNDAGPDWQGRRVGG
jgi:Tol biopolymer transport system component